MIFVFYDWSIPTLVENRKPTWTQEDVRDAFAHFVANSRNQIARQILPVFLVFCGGVFCGIQAVKGCGMPSRRSSSDLEDRDGEESPR
jgi:hypothetical protein